MARIPYVDPDNCAWQTKEILARRNNRNIHRMLGHAGPAADAFVRMAVTLRYDVEIDPILRELAILRVGILSQARYEVHAHKRIARRLGMSDRQIAAIEAGDFADPSLDDAAREVLAFTDDMVANVRASDATFDPLVRRLGHRALVELAITIGYYMSVCRFLETFDVEIDPDSL